MNSLRKLIQETLAELTQNPPVTYLFHGTSDKYLDSIMAQGLKEPYLTSDYTKAGYYATEVSEEVGGEPIILKVKIPDQSKLRVDYNELDEPVMNFNEGETAQEMKKKIQAAYKKYIKENPKSYNKKHDIISVDKHDYWVSLTTTRTVWYDGIIPFENVSFDGNNYVNEGHYTTWKKIEIDESSPIDQFQGTESEIAQKLAKHFNIGRMSPLGSGTSGFAYYIPNNRVLKITKDKTEVAEAYKIKGKKLKHLANVYGAYELHGKYEGTYVIISELLDYTEDVYHGEKYLKEILTEDHYQKELYYYNVDNFLSRIYFGKISNEKIEQVKRDIPVYLKAEQAQVALWFLDGMIGIFKELKKYNIQSSDWGTQNLGIKKDGTLAMFDLGYGDKTMPTKVKSIHLNEKGLGEDMKHLTADEYPDFFDGQFNSSFKNKPYTVKESEISQEELNKKSLPYKHADMIDDFILQKTEEEIREIAPTINLNRTPILIVKDLDDNYPSLFDNFADWIYSTLKK